jgi:hypothetical protein
MFKLETNYDTVKGLITANLKNFLLKPVEMILLIILVYIKELFVSTLSAIEIYPLLKSVFNIDVSRLNL